MVKNLPEVSVILPTYNRASLLERAIQSILCQDYGDFELIVVDDASTDRTEDVVSAIDDSRITYLRHEENRGGGAARNTGIQHAKGKWVAFQDSDDEWQPEKLSKQMAYLDKHPDVQVIYCAMLRKEGERTEYLPARHVRPRFGDLRQKLLQENLISTQTLVVKKDLLERVGCFDENLPRFQDWELAIRLAEVCEIGLIDEPLVVAHLSTDSVTLNPYKRAVALEHILAKHSDKFAGKSHLLAHHKATIGHFHCLCGNLSLGRSWLLQSLGHQPFKARAWFGLLMSCLGAKGYRSLSSILVPLLLKTRDA